MGSLGAFTFVLHTHIPYVRGAGRWPHGEEWLLEAMAECYVPLLDMLGRLEREEVPFRLCLSLTPVLLEQLSDGQIQQNFSEYTQRRADAADKDADLFSRRGEGHMASLARAYAEQYQRVRTRFQDRYHGDLVTALAGFSRSGRLQLITSAATHAYLPLLNLEGSIRLQLRTAITTHRRHLGARARAIWLPECAYRPDLERVLQEQGFELFFTDVHLLQGGPPRANAAGDAVGPYDWAQAVNGRAEPGDERDEAASTFRPYWVRGSQIAAVSRNARTGEQVWSASVGYPGDPYYREFHKRDPHSGLQYWRVTGADRDLGAKRPYRPDKARERAQQHADHFTAVVGQELREYHEGAGGSGLLTASYDTELFGHWWAEGVDWLEAVLRRLAEAPEVALMTPREYLAAHPPQRSIELREGSWGAGGGHAVWDNDRTRWMWDEIHGAEARFASALKARSQLTPPLNNAFDQAARELLLLQSSDWPFLVTTDQAPEYAEKRFRGHGARLSSLMDAVEAGRPASERVAELWRKDKVFPEIDPAWFGSREV